tara:strand:+ start:60 stop:299 length:240 start_codon:yes stop_codon:yes gene_type:complete
MSEEEVIVPLSEIDWDEYDDEEEEDEEEVCEHEWEAERVTDWSMHGSHVVHVCVNLYCPKCETYANTDCSWEFTDDEVL